MSRDLAAIRTMTADMKNLTFEAHGRFEAEYQVLMQSQRIENLQDEVAALKALVERIKKAKK